MKEGENGGVQPWGDQRLASQKHGRHSVILPCSYLVERYQEMASWFFGLFPNPRHTHAHETTHQSQSTHQAHWTHHVASLLRLSSPLSHLRGPSLSPFLLTALSDAPLRLPPSAKTYPDGYRQK